MTENRGRTTGGEEWGEGRREILRELFKAEADLRKILLAETFVFWRRLSLLETSETAVGKLA